MRSHGTVVDDDNNALEFRHSFLQLLNALSFDYEDSVSKWPHGGLGLPFNEVCQRLRYTLLQMDRAALLLGVQQAVLEDPANQIEQLDGQPIQRLAPVMNAWENISLYLDSIMHNLKQHADLLAAVVCYFYPGHSLPRSSLNSQIRWFTETQPEVDPTYASILTIHRTWYDKLARHHNDPSAPPGLRTAITHGRPSYQFGSRTVAGATTISIGMLMTPTRRQIQAHQSSWLSENVLDDIPELVEGYCWMLDDMFAHFGEKARATSSNAAEHLNRVLEGTLSYVKFTEPAPAPTSFNNWLFPRFTVDA